MNNPAQSALEFFRQADPQSAVMLLEAHSEDRACRTLLREHWIGEGQVDRAMPLIRAHAADDSAESCVNRSILGLLGGDLRAAVEQAQRAIQLDPDECSAYNHLGRALQNAGYSEDAVRCFEEAVQRDPGYAQAWHNLGHTLRAMGDHFKAVAAYQRALEELPGYRSARYNLGVTWSLMDQPERALACLRPMLEAAPDDVELWVNVGLNQHVLGQFAEAEQSFNEALRRAPGHPLAHAYLGILKNEQMQTERALQHLHRAIEADPETIEALCELANIHEKLNELGRAKHFIERALRLAPRNPAVIIDTARISRRDGDFEQSIRLLSALPWSSLPARQATEARFELAISQDAAARYDAAFESFSEANALAATSVRRQEVDPEGFQKRCRAVRAWLERPGVSGTAPPVETSENLGDSVCFMIGFPRSGTTLLDTALDSLPTVCAIEEKPTVETVLRSLEGQHGSFWEREAPLPEPAWRSCRAEYFEAVQAYGCAAGQYAWVVDKLPLRTIYAGFMGLLLPRARFIFSLRHPCDVILSNFMQNYAANEAFIHFDTLESSVRMYEMVMRLWLDMAPQLEGRCQVVRCEDLVTAPAETLAGVCSFLSLDYDDSMLSAEARMSRRGRIQTNSCAQVAEPIYTRSMARWEHYRKHFAPFADRLNPLLSALGYEPLSSGSAH